MRVAERGMRNLSLLLVAFVLLLPAVYGQIAIKGNTVWTMAGDQISNGVVLVKDGKIEAVGPASSISIPADYRVINAQFVTPGLIDAHSVIGLNGYLNQPHDQMALDGGASIQPELRAIETSSVGARIWCDDDPHGSSTVGSHLGSDDDRKDMG